MAARARIAWLLLTGVLTMVSVSAQRGSGPAGNGGTGGPGATGGRFGQPPRDAVAQAAGTAIIRGRILAADNGSPVRRAQVRATSAELRAGRLATTDAQGRYELRDLPAGRWTLTASKAGYVTLQYGQRRPLESGRGVELGEGETLDRVDIALPRGSAVTGHVYDEFGDPIAGARVQVLRAQLQQGIRRLVPTGAGDQTDDTGAFRVFGLAPGDYYVSATLRAGAGADGNTDGTSYAPTYYPGTGSLTDAQRITLAVSQEQGNINFALLPVRTVRISGIALDAAGQPITGGVVNLVESSDAALTFNAGASNARIRGDGSFTITNVIPGAYMLTATVTGGGRRGGGPGPFGNGGDPEFAAMPLNVGNDDLTGLTVVTAKGATLSGTIVTAEGSSSQLNISSIQVVAQNVRPGLPGPFNVNRNGRPTSDGTFQMTGLTGQRVLRLNGLPSGWMLESVRIGTADVTDRALEFRGNERLDDVRIVVTDRVPEVSGRVTARGQTVRDYSVVVFPDDETKWAFPSRFIQAGRPDQDGLFKLRALPPDDAYLAVAVDYLENGESADPQFLAQMRGRATRFSLSSGESKALDLPLLAR
jgi:hypothetical protein